MSGVSSVAGSAVATALKAPLKPGRKKAVLVVIAAHIDAGQSVTVREIMRRIPYWAERLHDAEASGKPWQLERVIGLFDKDLDKLEKFGLLRVERKDNVANRYEVMTPND